MNFTVTRGSLQSQCLNQVLKAERPDVDAKRSDLLKLQGTRYTYVYMAMFREKVLLLKSSSQHHRTKLNTLSSLFSGEFHLRLRHLEQSLLQALNEVKGRILDDDR